MKRLYLTFALAIFALYAPAQVSNCGTQATAAHLQELAEKVKLLNNRDFSAYRTLTHTVPVKIHIVRKSDQTTTISENMVVREFDKLNDLFSGAKLEFYLSSRTDFVDSDELYHFSQHEENSLAATRDEANVLNIYFVGSITSSSGNDICGYTYYPKSNKDRMVIASGCLNNTTTLAHEMGHYFALLHTHGMSGNEIESVDGTNCSVAGDLLCDTPADPNLDGMVNNECQYTGSETDPNGAPYNPDTRNIMSYAPSYCRAEFTQEQLDLISLVMEQNRSYLSADGDYEPVADIVASNPVNQGTRDLDVKLYPNPSHNNVGVEILDGYEGDFQIMVFNVTGTAIYQTPVRTYNTGNIVRLDLSQYGNGIYFINITAKRQRITKKIVLM
jgi:hypothetical protein